MHLLVLYDYVIERQDFWATTQVEWLLY